MSRVGGIPSSWEQKQNYLEFEVSQGYAAGPCLREKQGDRVLTQHR